MFKRLTRKTKNGNDEKIRTLQSMGFDATLSRNALDAANGDLETATSILISSASTSASPPSSNHATRDLTGDDEEEQLQRALQESRLTSNASISTSTQRTAAQSRAGDAAAARAQNASRRFGANGRVITKKKKEGKKTSTNKQPKQSVTTTSLSNPQKKQSLSSVHAQHPNVKVPTLMKDKSKEEQVLRCTKRLAPHSLAVDTLLRAFKAVRDEPYNDKYRKIDRSTEGYKRALKDKPGALDLLKAMNFQERPGFPHLTLDRSMVDPALLYLGISALEQVRESEEYLFAKQQIEFHKEVVRIKDGVNVKEEEEIVKRAAYISKCPTEPVAGAGVLMQISFGQDKIMRKFEGDDVLKDIVHWIGGHGSSIPDKILSRQWSLVNLNQYPIEPIDVKASMEKTLQSVGCWPSGKLEIRPSTSQWKNGGQNE